MPVIAGGVEASLRRVAHFDCWSETVKPTILATCKADLVGFGMGERVLVEVGKRLAEGKKISDCRDLRGVAYLLGSKETLPAHEWHDAEVDPRTVVSYFWADKHDTVTLARQFLRGQVMAGPRRTQSHGKNSKVYVPIIRLIFQERYREGMEEVDFSLDDIRDAADRLGVRERTRNAGDVVYRMRARTELPEEMRVAGFYIIRQVGRGRYRMEKAEGIIIDMDPEAVVIDALDLTPLPVRRLLPEDISRIDEQGLLTLVSYSKLLDHFTGLTVYRLRSHVRKSVAGVGQAEVDEVDVGIALSEEEVPVVFPIEAKATDDAVNRVQITSQVQFARQYFPGHSIRPLAVKVDHLGLIHFVEFNDETIPRKLQVLRRSTYRLQLSDRQRDMIACTTKVVL